MTEELQMDLSRNVGSDVAIPDNSAQMTKRPNIETLAEVADRLMAVRSSLNPNQHEFMWNELTLLAQDVRRLSGTEPQAAPMFECPDCGADLAIQTHKADCQRSGTHSLSRPQR